MTDATPRLAARTLSGAAWLMAARLGTRMIDFVGLLLLANLLLPADFGMIAVALTLVQIVEAIFEIPVVQVLVRSEAITRTLLDTAFTVGLLRGAALSLTLALLAYPFTILYHDPRLLPLICFLSSAPVLRGIASPAMAHFARAIDFRRDLLIEVLGKLFALGCSVPLAILTHSYWALAAGTVAGPAAMMALSFGFAPYRPRLSLAEWPVFSHFVGWMTAAQTVGALNWQIDRLLLARFVSKAELGSFSLAGDLAAVPEQALIKPTGRPLLSAFAALRGDMDRLRFAYSRVVTMLLAGCLPVVLGLSLLAEPVVRFALGPKWQASWPMLQWLVLTLIPVLLTAPLGSLAMALGRTEATLQRNLAELAIKLPLAIAGVWYFGTYGLIAARMISGVAMIFVCGWMVRRLIQMPARDQFRSIWRPACAGLAMTLALVALRPQLHAVGGLWLGIGLATCSATALLVYAGVLFALWHGSGRPQGIETIVAGQITARLARRATSLR